VSLSRCGLACSSAMRRVGFVVVLVFIVLALVVFVPFSEAEASDEPLVEWTQTYGSLQGLSVIQTSDGGYAIGGASSWSEAATFVKLDSSGNLQWTRAYSNIVSVVQTADNGYVLFCQNLVVKTNADGNLESSFSLGLNGSGTVEGGIVTRDGDYIVVGNSLGDNEEYFAWLYKFDAQGNILWSKKYTGGIAFYAVAETADRGCVMAGRSKNDFWLAKLDSNSNMQWDQTYAEGDPLDWHIVYSVVQSKDGGFLLAGAGEWHASGSGQVPWLIKVTSQGYKQFSLPYGHIPNDSFCAVVQADGGYALALGLSPGLVRVDSSGSELWNITLDSRGEWASNYRASSLTRTQDGGYAVAGTVFGDTAFIARVSPEPDTEPPTVIVRSPEGKAYETSDIPLIIAVNEPVLRIAYSLDGQPEVSILGNTTLHGLAVGEHSLTVSAQDLAGLVGYSATFHFTVASRFPIELVAAGIVIAGIVVVSFLAYVKKDKLSANKKRGLTSFFHSQHLAALTKNRTVWTLTITGLSILLVFTQIFFPYVYFSATSGNPHSAFEVGVTYVYEEDTIDQIYDEVLHIKDVGFNVIRVNLFCDSTDLNSHRNAFTDVFFNAVRQTGIRVALIINNHDDFDDLNYYLDRWGSYLTYVQILNEPDVASSWDMGALFTDDEAGSKFEQVYGIVEQHQLSAQYYTNFGPAFMVRTNLPITFSEKLDFVGFDVFMDSFLTLSPRMIQLLQKITNKDIVIAEFGMSTSDDQAQSDYLIKGLTLFKSMNLKGCWIVYWNSVNNIYGIRGRLAEQKVGEWIAHNT
jgi:hypothetical protein